MHVVGPTRAQVIRWLWCSWFVRLPIQLARHGTPKAIIQKEGSRWVLRALVTNEARLEALRARCMEAGSYMPEHTWGALEPGPEIIGSDSKREFIRALRPMDWPYTLG